MNDSCERLAYIMIFTAVGYSDSLKFSMKKPFNPLLGETFEYINDEIGVKLIGE